MTPELAAQLEPTIAENVWDRRARALTLLCLDGTTGEQAAAGGLDAAALLADSDMVRRVEVLSARPDIQDAALSAQVARTLRESVGTLAANMQSPDSSPAMVRDVAELVLKIAGMLDKRGDTRGNGRRERTLEIAFWDAVIETPEGRTVLSIHSRPFNDVVAALARALRCVSLGEVEAVIDTLNAGAGGSAGLTLPGF